MKKIYLPLYLILIICGNQLFAKKLTASLSYNLFCTPSNVSYIETYLSVSGKSVVFVRNASNKFQGSIQVSMVFKSDSIIRYADKYNLLSQEVEDTTAINFNFLDQQRIQLPDGNYSFELSISDNNSSDAPFINTQPIQIHFPKDRINISGIQFLESFQKAEKNGPLTKNGYDLVPYVNNFFPPELNMLKFYAEIYQAKTIFQDNGFLISYYLEVYETKITVDKYKVISKQNPKEVNVVLGEFNISELPSGNYNMVIEVRNNKNDLVAINQVFFQRSNSMAFTKADDFNRLDISNTFASGITDSIGLKDAIRSFRPISNPAEHNFEDFQLKKADLITSQRYLYNFWKSRNPADPEAGFRKYMEQVLIVNEAYKTQIDKGYETDRGRVYLQYGPPNDVVREERGTGTYPYEVWHYYKIQNYTNKKFIFYNRDLISNDYRLLHSDMPGENYESSWYNVLHKGNAKVNDDGRGHDRSFGDPTYDNFGGKNSSNPR